MGNKKSSINYPRSLSPNDREVRAGYNTPGYYRANRELRELDEPPGAPPDNYAAGDYDDLNTGKYENYGGDGYYGSNYGYVNSYRVGRDYEQNAGYRENYNRLPQGGFLETEEEMVRGQHRGKGPRNYRRPDARILDDIHDRLCQDDYLDATDIDVAVNSGEVILTGYVEDRAAKRRAEDVIETVPGITHLENRLRTHIPGQRIMNQKP